MKYSKPTVFSIIMIALGIVGSTILSGCQASNTAKGGAIGASAGGALGALIGHQSDNTAAGAIIGAAVGGTAGSNALAASYSAASERGAGDSEGRCSVSIFSFQFRTR